MTEQAMTTEVVERMVKDFIRLHGMGTKINHIVIELLYLRTLSRGVHDHNGNVKSFTYRGKKTQYDSSQSIVRSTTDRIFALVKNDPELFPVMRTSFLVDWTKRMVPELEKLGMPSDEAKALVSAFSVRILGLKEQRLTPKQIKKIAEHILGIKAIEVDDLPTKSTFDSDLNRGVREKIAEKIIEIKGREKQEVSKEEAEGLVGGFVASLEDAGLGSNALFQISDEELSEIAAELYKAKVAEFAGDATKARLREIFERRRQQGLISWLLGRMLASGIIDYKQDACLSVAHGISIEPSQMVLDQFTSTGRAFNAENGCVENDRHASHMGSKDHAASSMYYYFNLNLDYFRHEGTFPLEARRRLLGYIIMAIIGAIPMGGQTKANCMTDPLYVSILGWRSNPLGSWNAFIDFKVEDGEKYKEKAISCLREYQDRTIASHRDINGTERIGEWMPGQDLVRFAMGVAVRVIEK